MSDDAAMASDELAYITDYLKVLKAMVMMDDHVDPAELALLEEAIKSHDLPETVVDAIRSFDPKTVSFEALTGRIEKRGNDARLLICDLVTIARADGHYGAQERSAVRIAAAALEVDHATVASIEVLIELQHAVEQLRAALLPLPNEAPR